MSLIINYRFLVIIVFVFFTTTLLSACGRQKCRQEPLILLRTGYFNLEEIERHNLPRLMEKDLIESNIVKNTILNLELKKNNQTLSEKDFLKNLKIKIIPNTDVISFQYIDSNREQRARVVNTVVDDYLTFIIRESQKKKEKTPESIKKQQTINRYKLLWDEHQKLKDSFEQVCVEILCSYNSIADIDNAGSEQLIELKNKFDTNERKMAEFIDNNSELFRPDILTPQSFSLGADIIQYAVYPCPN